MNEEMRFLLEAVRLIMRDRIWNNKDFESMAKITDANISKILNPKTAYEKGKEAIKRLRKRN